MRAGHFDRTCGRPRHRGLRIGLATGVLGLAFASACTASEAGASHPTLSSGVEEVGVTLYAPASRTAAPDLTGSTLDGTKFSLDKADAHRIVVLNVWASWCAPCRAESPLLAATAERLRGTDVTFLGLDERDTDAKARAFVAKVHTRYPHLVDHDGALLLKLRILPQAGVPSTLVLDRHGRMAARVIGPVKAAALQRIIDGLTAET